MIQIVILLTCIIDYFTHFTHFKRDILKIDYKY